MAGLDLSGLTRVVEQLFIVDQVLITRDPQPSDTLDPATGRLVETPGIQVYDGLGAVQPMSEGGAVLDPAVQRIVEESGATYRLLLPSTANPDLYLDDVVRVTVARMPVTDPRVTERSWQVAALPPVTSFATVRFAYLKTMHTVELQIVEQG